MTTAEKVGDFETGWPLLNRASQAPITAHPLPPHPPQQSLPSQPKENMSGLTSIIKRRPVGSQTQPNTSQGQALSPVQSNGRARSPPVIQRKASFEVGDDMHMRQPLPTSTEKASSPYDQSSEEYTSRSSGPPPVTQSIPYRQRQTVQVPQILHEPQSAVISSVNDSAPSSRHVSYESADRRSTSGESAPLQPFQYHHQLFDSANKRVSAGSSTSSSKLRQTSGEQRVVSAGQGHRMPGGHALLGADLARPASAAYSSGSEGPNRTLSPGRVSNGRTPSPSRYSEHRLSYVDLLNVPYPQPPPASSSLDDAHLRSSVGQNASILGTKKTLEMYRQNAKKTNDPTIQYEFAVWMVNSAQEMAAAEGINIHGKAPHHASAKDESSSSPAELLREARHILQRLSDRSYPYAQYYLADGYASGLFAKGLPDNDHAFPLFTSAAKHGHAEAGYRAALSFEFGWGCRKDFQKAVQYFRQSASKNHPGAMSRLGRACLVGDLGLSNRQREGFKWLKRAAESADFQYNSAPYELGLLHESGYGDDIFRDEAYAAQLFTQSADLGHAEANYRLGDAYEHGKLSCPKDPALSVHFYTGAAQKGHSLAMMALCAWYMVGAVPILEKDEAEACEWAKRAADTGLPKAEYAVGYFTEMGIGTRRDPLEANVWYVRAADQGDERAKHRIAAIRAAASGGSDGGGGPRIGSTPDEAGKSDKGDKRWKIF